MSVTIGFDKGTFFGRQFDTSSPVYINMSREEFTESVREYIKTDPTIEKGYADFCGVVRMPNNCGMKYGLLKINDDNKFALISSYVGRGKDLRVLQRSFSLKLLKTKEFERDEAKWLYIEMYTKEQMKFEDTENGITDTVYTDDWTIFNVKPMMEKNEHIPNVPITLMRNALGPKFGGSGLELNTDEYNKSVEFFNEHAFVDVNC